MAISIKPSKNTLEAGFWFWLGPFLYMLMIGIYYVVRYNGNWAESDTVSLSNFTQHLLTTGDLLPESGKVYNNGYGFQVISAYIVTLTGLDVASLAQLVYPLLASLVVLVAWLFYREVAGNNREATIVTLLLFSQPEFLFVLLRSSHEKFSRTLFILSLFWLVRSFRLYSRNRSLAVYIFLFYLSAYGVIATNNLIGISFILIVAIALGIGWFLRNRFKGKLVEQNRYLLQRLAYASLICLGLAFFFTFYIYPPAKHDLLILHTLVERIASLFLDVQTRPADIYNQVTLGWINLPVYFLLSSANWIIILTSGVVWARQGWRWIIKRQTPESATRWLLWLFYTAFGAQGLLTVVSDFSGSIGNLQLRLFPSFSIIAVSFTGMALANWRPHRFKTAIKFSLAVIIFFISTLSVLKASNEPLLSNKWIFYRPEELTAMQWVDNHYQNATIWSEFDERLWASFLLTEKDSKHNNIFSSNLNNPRTILVTNISYLRSRRLQIPLPVPSNAMRVYDSGIAQLYHLRAETPFQR